MYLSEMLIREHQEQRLREAAEARLGWRASELRRLRQVQQRAERRWRKALRRTEELRTAS
jgi:hypothetical protein